MIDSETERVGGIIEPCIRKGTYKRGNGDF